MHRPDADSLLVKGAVIKPGHTMGNHVAIRDAAQLAAAQDRLEPAAVAEG
jgi:hypothetical protein